MSMVADWGGASAMHRGMLLEMKSQVLGPRGDHGILSTPYESWTECRISQSHVQGPWTLKLEDLTACSCIS